MEIMTASILHQLAGEHRNLLEHFDPKTCIAAFDKLPDEVGYHDIPDAVTALWREVTAQFGAEGFDAFQRLTLLQLIGAFSERSANRRYTDAIKSCFDKSFRRIIGHITDRKFEKYRTPNDILYKDLGLCRQKIFPAGARVVEPDSGFARSLMFRADLGQAMRMVRLLLKTGGNRHWYLVHTHLSELEEFNPEGWQRCCLRLAGMLEINPNVRGMWGGSWLYDPALETVSPRLSYVRKLPQQNGAMLFYSNVDIDGGALSYPPRRKAYLAGNYLPKAYAVIWPRRAMLAWAQSISRDARGE
ncbi:MAG TPA: hypothetical protein VMM15_25720 [Bradyrhizobium sp.]|nr:hypothetical protein [Bradyrhizobium sp.]